MNVDLNLASSIAGNVLSYASDFFSFNEDQINYWFIYNVSLGAREAVLDVIIKMLAERRFGLNNHLHDLRKSNQLPDVLCHTDYVFDRHASIAERILPDIFPLQSSILLLDLHTVYHLPYLTVKIADLNKTRASVLAHLTAVERLR